MNPQTYYYDAGGYSGTTKITITRLPTDVMEQFPQIKERCKDLLGKTGKLLGRQTGTAVIKIDNYPPMYWRDEDMEIG